jgi:hypothetical protein
MHHLRWTLLFLAAELATSSFGHAALITHRTSSPLFETPGLGSLSLPQFDPALGRLISIEGAAILNTSGTVTLMNPTPDPIFWTVAPVALGTLTTPSGDLGLCLEDNVSGVVGPNATTTETFSFIGFIGGTCVGGDFFFSGPDARYIGTGEINFPFQIGSFFQLWDVGNANVTGEIFASIDLEIQYEYTEIPEPSNWISMLAGLAVLSGIGRAVRQKT